MYKTCKDCAIHFIEPKQYTETHGFTDGRYEAKMGCPVCGGTYISAIECNECTRRITGSYIKTNSGQRICENCHIKYKFGEETS